MANVVLMTRHSHVQAGIPSNQLTLALEPEVASLYCNTIPLASPDDDGAGVLLHSGAKYVLIDAGGGTIDIIAHEVMNDGSLNEIHQSNGGPWGGTAVDKEYFNFLKDLIGNSVFDNFKKQHMDDYIYLCREFEQKKKTIKPEDVSKVTTPLPGSLKNLFENEKHQDLATSIMSSDRYSEDVTLVSDKIRLDVRIMKGFFAGVLKYIYDYLKLIFSGDSMKDVNTIMMVGGFSESKMLQEMVRNLFPEKTVLVPPQAGLAVLKGAVLFGHNPAVIGHRVCRYSYGVKTSLKFENGKHREDKRKTVGDKDLCVDIFDIHIHRGQSVKLNAKQVPMVYKPQKPGQKTISFKFYSSSECYPMYVTDEGCMELGKITVDVLGESTVDNAVEVSFKFGGTEIRVEAIDKKTGKTTHTKVDFIE
ncbi:hypothetical protein ACJMK2_039180 [Sinanodonta woodiana]|uniref:Uncharacterized protein n=1 Tax=Sinanodonta woodiana TaxID=1069815 RepID=A0ABD3WB85_SINWO